MSDEIEEDYLEQYEVESLRRASREARLLRMRKQKKRQQMFRRIMPVVLVLILATAGMIFYASGAAKRMSGEEDIQEEEDNSGTDGETVKKDAAKNRPVDESGDEEETPEEVIADAEYGCFAEVWSDEKEIFFDGYEVTWPENVAHPSEEDVRSTYAVLIDADTGEVIASRDGNAKIYPASMTKIMTILVAAERVNDLDAEVLIDQTITDFVFSHDCSAVNFDKDEHVTVRDLMYGTILPSGADAALALAEYVAGSEDRFVILMNEKLEELGLSDTAHFTNCVGIYNDQNYCTLTDVAMIMKAAVENDLAKEILKEHKYTTSKTPEHPEGIEISNWFLRRIEDKDTHGEVLCAKTGFVNESGCCGASYAISDSGKHYICVTADAWSSWRCIYDHVAMYDAYTE